MSEAIDLRIADAIQTIDMAGEILSGRGLMFTANQLTNARRAVVQVLAEDAEERARLATERDTLESKMLHLRDWLLSLRHRGEASGLWEAVDEYAGTKGTLGQKMHAAICAFLKEVEGELHESFWDNISQCDTCGIHLPIDILIPHFDVHLCTKCDIEANARFTSCAHEWEDGADPNGEPAQHCARCSWTVPHHHAAKTFPFVCDGWIQEPVA